MNKFFLIAKGQMRYLFNSQRVFANFSDPNNTTYYPYATFCRLPLYAKADYSGLYYDGNEANTSGGFIDENTGELFYHMYIYIFRFLVRNRMNFGYYFSNIIFPEVVITVVVSIILFGLFYYGNNLLEESEKRSALKFV